ncbi:MAG TPA: phosphopantetheine adenylyltransferase [Caldimonas sp.]|jgi:hypothetical protein|nr:phosphopantetheine adenylyltransferase [Caldimonas sp.]HEX2541156.1 phosphopantetheine adenylyltransferase [Caldimonas sp.]
MRHFVSAMLVVVGIIHLLPASGVLGAERLAQLYGMSFGEPNLTLLMRHRAVLFGLLGVFLTFAAFKPAFQPIAFAAGFVSVISFLWLAWTVGDMNAAIRRVVLADVVALLCLVLGAAALAYVHRDGKSPVV